MEVDREQAEQAERAERAERAKVRPWRSRYIMRRAANFLDRGLLEEAEVFLCEAAQREPFLPSIHTMRGRIFLKTFKNNKAIEALTSAISLDDKNATVFYNRGLAFQRQAMRLLELNGGVIDDETTGFLERAIKDYTSAIFLNRFCPEAFANRAGCYARLRKMRQAGKDMNLAIQLRDGSSELHKLHSRDTTGPNSAKNGSTQPKDGEKDDAIAELEEAFGTTLQSEKASDWELKRRTLFGRLRKKSMSTEGSHELIKLLKDRSQVMGKLGNSAASKADDERVQILESNSGQIVKE